MDYYIVDVESTGLQVDKHELTEVSIIRCKDLVQRSWYLAIKHPEYCDEFALQITGKTKKELISRSLYVEDIVLELESFLDEDGEEPDTRVGIAHNASFDRRMLEYNWKILNRKFPIYYWLDTKDMARKYIKNVLKIQNKVSLKQDDLIQMLNLKSFEKNGHHSAEVDTRNLFRMWNYFVKQGKMSNSEFVKISPDLGQNVVKKNSKIDQHQNISDIMDELEGL